ncbi:hypothetical protein Poli38472_013766 [Pythium oligandrum]|uniref:AB hydrolase-1 domain-containing protein n=1 Tax=Pythium oligandrum TaxID=41045 RepID=A0A8K1FK22_PYTOL|nr:hypothetical protein Poli38472_013766 [Pythium oligandrum]|eukprot:TMW61303.1 hypothetical protein Poli38472_013766 [Pythium oligandrum]
MRLHKFEVDVDGADGVCAAHKLLTLLATNGEVDDVASVRFEEVMVYFHGFPDLAVHPTELDMASRMPFKLAEAWLDLGAKQDRADGVAFVTFNFGGVAGSDSMMRFEDKTITQEVEDAARICDYVRQQLLLDADKGRVHVVGLSTGAIIASLLREKGLVDTISVLAGLLDLRKGIEYDFTASQMEQFDREGACWKEFYLPEGSTWPQNACVSLDGVSVASDAELQGAVPRKLYLRLQRRYVDECLQSAPSLNIQRSVSSPTTTTGRPVAPLLVVHGEADQNVPKSDGEALFTAAAAPKHFVAIPKGNHLLSNSKHLKKAVQTLLAHIGLGGA